MPPRCVYFVLISDEPAQFIGPYLVMDRDTGCNARMKNIVLRIQYTVVSVIGNIFDQLQFHEIDIL